MLAFGLTAGIFGLGLKAQDLGLTAQDLGLGLAIQGLAIAVPAVGFVPCGLDSITGDTLLNAHNGEVSINRICCASEHEISILLLFQDLIAVTDDGGLVASGVPVLFVLHLHSVLYILCHVLYCCT